MRWDVFKMEKYHDIHLKVKIYPRFWVFFSIAITRCGEMCCEAEMTVLHKVMKRGERKGDFLCLDLFVCVTVE